MFTSGPQTDIENERTDIQLLIKNEFDSDANTIEKFQTLSKSSGRIVFRELSFRR